MKYAVFLGDGMADYKIAELGGKTPLEAAVCPNMDALARRGTVGMAQTVPTGMPPGSDTANLAVFGYDPKIYYSGRSPLEAASMGIRLNDSDVTYRCNTVTLTERCTLEHATMADFSGGEIESADSHELIAFVNSHFETCTQKLYPGVSYRHCLVLRNAQDGACLTPPHDISGKPIKEFMPTGTNSELLREMMEFAYKELPRHPVNRRRAEEGKKIANGLWFWGEGRKPRLTSFKERFGVQGGVISAVDLLHGIGKCAGLRSISVEGACGNYHTDFAAKGRAAVNALKTDCDFVYIHVEAPDECGHHGELHEKVWSIEQIDEKIVGPVMEYLEHCGEPYAVLLMPDHPTPIAIMTHTGEPVPFVLCRSGDDKKMADAYSEEQAAATGVFVPNGSDLMGMMITRATPSNT